MNIITFELCAEDRARLDRLAAALEGMRIPEVTLETLNPRTALPETPVEEKKFEAPAEPEKPKATKADVQAIVQKLATPTSGKRDEVKRIVNEYAPRVSGIPEDKLDEVMQRLMELGGENA